MEITFEFACRDDCLDAMVPSDLRKVVSERDAAQSEVKRLSDELWFYRASVRSLRDLFADLPEQNWQNFSTELAGQHDEAISEASHTLSALTGAPCSDVWKRRDAAIRDVRGELRRAERKFPGFPIDPLHALAIVQEEVGETQKAVLQACYEPHKSTPDEVRDEAIQMAAMALRFLFNLPHMRYCTQPQVDRYGSAIDEDHNGANA
jgi:hypothetical protein